MGTFKQSLNSVCDYVLSNKIEEEDLVLQLRENTQGMTRHERRVYAENHIWFHAYRLMNGRQDTRKKLTEIVNSVDGNHYGG